MSCPRCGFFNMPGAVACVSCATPLGGAGGAVAIAVAPPRATAFQKKMRQARTAILGSPIVVEDRRPGAAVALLGLLPGLPQAFLGFPVAALVFGAVWTTLVAAAAWLFGTVATPFLIGGAIGAHFTSALQPWRGQLNRLSVRTRIFVTLASYAFLAGGLYYPLYQLARTQVTPVEMNDIRENAFLKAGDTVLVWKSSPGEVPARGAIAAFNVQVRWEQRIVVDRLLGLPGDRIQWKDGVWSRNGLVLGPAEQPLARTPMPEAIDLVVPPGACFMWPSLNMRVYGAVVPAPTLGLMPAASLAGLPSRITAPFSRRGPIESR